MHEAALAAVFSTLLVNRNIDKPAGMSASQDIKNKQPEYKSARILTSQDISQPGY
jgi:hypothetical protein